MSAESQAAAVAVRPDPGRARAEDEALIRAIAAGDGRALRGLYDRHAGTVLALLSRMLGARAEAEELLQEVFVELWRRAPAFDPARGSPVAWVVTIARSRGLDALRARARRGGADRTGDQVLAAAAGPASQHPDAVASASQRRGLVRAALDRLSREQRRAVELAYYEGLAYPEIADRVGVPLGTVKSRIIAAMRILREALHGHVAKDES